MTTDSQLDYTNAANGWQQQPTPTIAYGNQPAAAPYVGVSSPYAAQAGYGQQPAGYQYLPSVGMPGYGQPSMPLSNAKGAPSVVPVVIFTALFGMIGAISASRRARRAKAAGVTGDKYWIAFGATILVTWLLCLISIIFLMSAAASSGPAITSAPAQITSAWLESSIVQEGDFRDLSGQPMKVQSATCTTNMVDDAGAGTYACVVDFLDDARYGYTVTVDAAGKWVTR